MRFVRRAKRSGCTLAMGETLWILGERMRVRHERPVLSIRYHPADDEAEKVILATGGQSYPACGTTGDGYRWAAALGHRIVTPHTALVPITSHAPWVLALQGVTLPDVVVRVIDVGRQLHYRPAHQHKGGVQLPVNRRSLAAAAAPCCSPISAFRGRR